MIKDDIEKIEQKVNETINSTKDKALAIGVTIADKVKDKTQVLNDKVKDLGNNVCGYVHENPWKAVGIGIVAGMVLARLLGSRKR